MSQKHKPFVPATRLQCCGKNRYATQHEAEQVAREQELLRHDLALDVYRCTCGCGDWHLTRHLADSKT